MCPTRTAQDWKANPQRSLDWSFQHSLDVTRHNRDQHKSPLNIGRNCLICVVQAYPLNTENAEVVSVVKDRMLNLGISTVVLWYLFVHIISECLCGLFFEDRSAARDKVLKHRDYQSFLLIKPANQAYFNNITFVHTKYNVGVAWTITKPPHHVNIAQAYLSRTVQCFRPSALCPPNAERHDCCYQ